MERNAIARGKASPSAQHGHLFSYLSDRLRSDREVVQAAVSNDVNAWKYAIGPLRKKYDDGRTVDSVMDEIENKALDFSNVPDSMRLDPILVRAAVEAGRFDFYGLPESMRNDKTAVLECIRGDYRIRVRYLPEHLQLDEEIAVFFLENGYDEDYGDILKKLPSLCRSRPAMMKVAAKIRARDYYRTEMIRKCPFRDDADFMLAAGSADCKTFQLASRRLLTDPEFMLAASKFGCGAICHAPPDFLVANLDLVEAAIRNHRTRRLDTDWRSRSKVLDTNWLRRSNVLRHRQVVMALLEERWPILGDIKTVHRSSPFLSDKEVIALSVNLRASDLACASSTLKADRQFILELVSKNERILHFAAKKLRRDHDILVAAVAKSAGTIVDCFDVFNSEKDIEFLVEFAARVRAEVQVHQNYVREVLRGISTCNPAQVAPDHRCQLPLLDCGPDTSVAFKRLIAEFAGVPIGAEFVRYKAALSALEEFGF